MADHGKNRRRSLFARRKWRVGQHKARLWMQRRSAMLEKWRIYWQGGKHPAGEK